MPAEVSPTCLGDLDLGGDNAVIGTGWDTLDGSLNILDSLFHVTLDIEGETRGLGDSKTEVKSDDTRDTSETNEETPAVVNADGGIRGVCKDGALVGVDDDEGDEGGSCEEPRSMSWQSWQDIKLTYQSCRNPGRRR